MLFGATKNSAVPLADQLALLRPGDLLTYCFYSGDGSIVEDGRVLDCVWDARERGVLFDVGDGATADFCVVRAGDEPEVMKDGPGETRTGYRWEPVVTVLAGEVV